MCRPATFSLEKDTVMLSYSDNVANYCTPFSCGDSDLDDFFQKDALLYDREYLGRTYAWIDQSVPSQIVGMITLANDSIKARYITTSSTRNRLQRNITNAKRGRSYPAVLIGRLGVSETYQNKGYRIGSQILNFIKDWFRSSNNKTGCRFIVVDAYNNMPTLRFYEKNGFKPLFKNQEDELRFFGLDTDQLLRTRFYYFDLKWI